jgi:GNAT superfamily N-acetyltransferase
MSVVKSKVTIRMANEKDFDDLISLICALADYEKLEKPNKEVQERLRKDLFRSNPKAETLLAFVDDKAVGYAFYFYTYSSFLALPTFYLEDIFVLPEYRSQGIGKILFRHCAKVALENNCGRMEWQVLDWNKIAIDFYKQIRAKQMKEWLPFRMTRNELEEFVKS